MGSDGGTKVQKEGNEGGASDQPVSHSLARGTVLGQYEIVRQIGHGGMGAVYEATHTSLGHSVAVKTLHGQFATSPNLRERFVREGRAACRVEHDHAVRVFDLGVQGEVPYLAMEFLKGEDLGAVIQREKRLSPERAVDIILPVLAALAAAHECGIVHRDLKPDNIFLCKRPGGGVHPKLVDFGISKFLDDGSTHALTGTSAILGTPYYMSPEQAKTSRDVNARSDQYSMGVILYELVTGRRPFHGDALYSLFNAIVEGKYPRPRSIVPEVPEALEHAIVRAMHKDPGGRFPSARALGAALLEHASERARILYGGEFQLAAGDGAESSSSPGFDATQPADCSAVTGKSGASVRSGPDIGSTERPLSTIGSSAGEVAPRREVPRRRLGTTVLALTAVAVLVAAVLGWRALSERAAPEGAPPVAAEPSLAPPSAAASYGAAASAVAQTSATAVPKPVSKRIVSIPEGASLSVDGKPAGTTPAQVELPPEQGSVSLELRRVGFRPANRVLSRDDPAEVTIKLKPQVAPPAAAAKPQPRRPTAPSLAPR